MKAKITHKKKQTKVDFEDKFLDEQKYAEQNFHLVDASHEIPEFADESGIAPDEDENEPDDNEELKKGKPADKKSKRS